ncbi:ribulose-phosphate 3-epimerase [Glaciecola sp. 1036]|uniref:ribulose-phosphate 3-epimerase n=1 Tax=Alteromonadaceae TaxID=72275 RepID=UPI003D0622C3
MLIAPSILSADFTKLGQEVADVIQAGADIVHFDVMDNHYVPNLTFGPKICSDLVKFGLDKPIDVHLMVTPVDDLIVAFADAGASMISFHPEASLHLDRSINLIKSKGCKAGLVLNPGTSLTVLEEVLPMLDYVLLMSVNPGYGGQSFIPSTIDKIKRLKSMLEARNLDIPIEVDGGINADTISDCYNAGASIFVAGSAIFNSDNYQTTINQLRQVASK